MDIDKDKAVQGIAQVVGSALLAACVWIFRRLRRTAAEERPILHNGHRRAVLEAIKSLEGMNESLAIRITEIEQELVSESEFGKREHARLRGQIRQLEADVRRLLDEQPEA